MNIVMRVRTSFDDNALLVKSLQQARKHFSCGAIEEDVPSILRLPVIFHLHGALMVSWLGLLVTQSLLAGRGGLALHRSLGWSSAAVVPMIAIVGSLTCVTALRAGMAPPFFTPAYFLALVHVGVIALARCFVFVDISSRRQQ